jgi:hypothetical protein
MSLILAGTIISVGLIFTCTPTRVWDGDGPLWCEEGPRIRLTGIAARKINREGRDGSRARMPVLRTHAIGEPVGRSREGHILVEGPPMQCVSARHGQREPTSAWCVSPKGGDLSCAMVEGAYALGWERFWRDHSCL